MNSPNLSLPPSFNKQESSIFSAILSSIQLLSEKEPDKTPVLKEFSARISTREYRSENEMIDDFIGFLDIFFIDQISDQREFLKYRNNNHPCLSLYARDRNFHNLSYGDGDENYNCECLLRLKGITPSLDEYEKTILRVDSLDGVFDILRDIHTEKLIYISEPLTYQEYDEFLFKCTHSKLPVHGLFLIMGFIDIGNNISIQFYLYEKRAEEAIFEKYISLFMSSNQDDAVTYPDIQSIFRAYLSHGRNIIGRKVVSPSPALRICESTSQEVSGLISDNPTKKRLQKIWPLRVGVAKNSTDSFLRKHERHYSTFFEDSILGKPQVSLTSSGAGANNVVAGVLKKYIPKKVDWVGIHFYYENQMPFGSISVSKNTRVLGLCPTLLMTQGGESIEDFKKGYTSQIEQFFSNARENSGERYYIFVDITTRIEQDISSILSHVPSNVTVIATASLTKHQRGGVNYFFGSIAVYNNPELHEEIQEMNHQTLGALTQDQILSLPRLRKRETINNSINRKKNQAAFEYGFLKVLETHALLPMPKLIHNDFGTFILLPIPEILYYIKYLTSIPEGEKIGVDDLAAMIRLDSVDKESFIGFHPTLVPTFMSQKLLAKSGVLLRDSFGFRENSCSSIYVPYSSYFEGEEPKFPVKKVETIRIALGYRFDEKKSKHQGALFALGYLEYMYNRVGFPYK